jgi:hypothetical protein
MDNRTDELVKEHWKRDSESFLMLGSFLFILAFIVLLATIPQESGHARVINFCAGLLLAGIGVSMASWGWVLRKRSQRG